ncbi:Hypothetical predicted protein [Olea europaea subsp. europaea]|uniref:Uncharacterized protein n=1 Tax=Olea europaea subsp. europaea TaxID=158383 RepID=A0A8S0SF71_OLEEU|nr:Hypothetical predicted protein [Olea europaea subsp. europaea]
MAAGRPTALAGIHETSAEKSLAITHRRSANKRTDMRGPIDEDRPECHRCSGSGTRTEVGSRELVDWG